MKPAKSQKHKKVKFENQMTVRRVLTAMLKVRHSLKKGYEKEIRKKKIIQNAGLVKWQGK